MSPRGIRLEHHLCAVTMSFGVECEVAACSKRRAPVKMWAREKAKSLAAFWSMAGSSWDVFRAKVRMESSWCWSSSVSGCKPTCFSWWSWMDSRDFTVSASALRAFMCVCGGGSVWGCVVCEGVWCEYVCAYECVCSDALCRPSWLYRSSKNLAKS